MNIAPLINLILYLLIVGLLVALVQYVVRAVPIPDPFGRIINIAAVVIAILVVVLVLLSMVGGVNVGMPVITTR